MKKIVILGAGFGGLRAAVKIAKKLRALGLTEKYEVALIDRNDYQTYTPLLYEVATTSENVATATKLHSVATYDIKSLLARLPIAFIEDEVESMDLTRGDIHLKNRGEIIADYLVIALGSEMNYFGIDGLKENSLPLKTFNGALKIRDAVWSRAAKKRSDVKILIGGGGSTGVELAGELKSWCGELEQDFQKCNLNVKIIEAAESILSGLDKSTIELAQRRLKNLGIEVLANTKISAATKTEIVLENGSRLPYDVLIWSGGTKSPNLLAKLPLHVEPRGRPVVAGEMECLPQTPDLKLYSKVYGLGDSVCFNDPVTKKSAPAVAPAAIEQADVVAHNIVEEIKASEFGSIVNGQLSMVKYVPHDYPYVIPIGGKWAIAKIGPLVIAGFSGWIIKGLVELNYLFSIMPFLRALKIWFKGLKIFIQNDRLG